MTTGIALSTLIERGGVYYNIGGSSPAEALREGIKGLSLPKDVDRAALTKAVLEREALMPTAIGNGVAIPHPRNPIIFKAADQRVSVLFLKTPIPYDALDGKPVSVLFLILSSEAKSHLSVLASLTHLCQRRDFLELLADRPSTGELAGFIRAAEDSWKAAPAGS
ncbi:MAG TPA: PTS sugar transporter subunit IIA [Rectinemataceae bacterium]|nr:PTS sugar transporter subunit IIA [Rectinemataceae bacterium]